MAQQRSEETRAKLLESALQTFSQVGFEAASIDEICAAAGVSKGAYYHHFPSKQAVFIELLESWLTGIDEQIAAARAETPDVSQAFIKMGAALPGIFRDAERRLPMFLEFWARASRDPEVWERTISPYHRYRDVFAAWIRQGVREGAFREMDAQAGARMLIALAIGLLLQGILEPDGADWAKATRQSLQIMLEGMGKK
jgi:AcrR family transcriptional regulator